MKTSKRYEYLEDGDRLGFNKWKGKWKRKKSRQKVSWQRKYLYG